MSSEVIPSPYRGIHPFRFIDRNYYFGREELIEDLTAKVLLYRLVVLFGESGVGKSSLLNAGLIGALQNKAFQPELLRLRPFEDKPISVEQVESGGSRQYLPSIFDLGNSPENGQSTVISLDHFEEKIKANVQGKHLVLIFDQFEELFTLFGQKGENGSIPTETLQIKLLQTIVKLISNPRLKTKIVIAIREDYLAKLDVLAHDYPQVFDNRVLLTQLDNKDAARAVLCPFRTRSFFESRITTKLAAAIIRELSNNRTHGSIHPTQLQIVCSRLWERFAKTATAIGTAQFREMGGTRGIIEGFLTSELDTIDQSLKPSVISVLTNLITDSNTRDVVSKKRLEELTSRSPGNYLGKTLDLLEKRRLINSIPERGTTFYELSSEFLIAPIQKEREQHLLSSEREHERAAVRRQMKIVLAIVIPVTLIIIILAFTTAKIARERTARDEAKKLLEQESLDHSKTRTLLNNLSELASDEPEKRKAARANITQLAKEGQVPLAVGSLIEDVVTRKDPDLAVNYLNALSQVLSKTPVPVETPVPEHPITVQVQIFSDNDHLDRANKIRIGLQDQDIVVSGIQTTVQGPKNNELRYFIIADEDSANDTATRIKQLGLTGTRAIYVPGYQNSTFAKNKQFELWLQTTSSPSPTPEPQASPIPSPVPQSGWFVVADLEQPTMFRRLNAVNLVFALAGRDGVRPHITETGVMIGPYRDQVSAQRAQMLVTELMTTVKLREPPSVSFIDRR